MAESPSQPDNPDKPEKSDRPPTGKQTPVLDNRSILLKYPGLGAQVCLAVVLSVFAGLKADKWAKTSFPLFAWVLPLLVIVALIVKLIKDTTGNGGKH